MNIENDIKLDFSDVLLKPKRSTLESRSQVNLIKRFIPKYGTPFSGVPIVCANMATGTFPMLKEFMKHEMFVAIAKHNNHLWKEEYDKDHSIIDYGFYSIGMNYDELDELLLFYDHVRKNEEVEFDIYLKAIHESDKIKICIDIANGYTEKFAGFVKHVRKVFPNNVIMAGNVVTSEMTEQLILAGADYVKIGLGSGGNCSTRRQTAIGYPQLSAIAECSDSAHGLGGGIVGDGGIRTPGDVSKALCSNSDMVMIGGMFAGTDECDGEIIYKVFETNRVKYIEGDNNPPIYVYEHKQFMTFYGMSSEYAQKKHGDGMKDYRSSEGTVSEVPYVGKVENVIKDILGGVRSTGTYIGARNIKDFGKCATFIRVNQVHDRNL